MIDVRFRSLPKWTEKRPLKYKSAAFRSAYSTTLKLLDGELTALVAKDVLIEAGFSEDDIRLDGWPRANVRPYHPGVILYYSRKGETFRMPSGNYDRMEHNLHAIALTLMNLRAVDRYGVTLGHEQYQGFKQLPAPSRETYLTVEGAAVELARLAGISLAAASEIVASSERYTDVYRTAVKLHHPDTGGNRAMWDRLQVAALTLQEHFAAKKVGHS